MRAQFYSRSLVARARGSGRELAKPRLLRLFSIIDTHELNDEQQIASPVQSVRE